MGTSKGAEFDDTDRKSLGYMLFAHYVGLLELLVHEDIDDATFRARAIYGGLQMIVPYADAESPSGAHSRLREAKQAIAKLGTR